MYINAIVNSATFTYDMIFNTVFKIKHIYSLRVSPHPQGKIMGAHLLCIKILSSLNININLNYIHKVTSYLTVNMQQSHDEVQTVNAISA
jgi:hypothetical protein